MEQGDGRGFHSYIMPEVELIRLVTTEMIRMGFVPCLKGFVAMRELVILALKNKKIDKLMDMYEVVADKIGTKRESLERNARTLVNRSYYVDEGFANLYGFFGLKTTYAPPTVGQILALFTEYMVSVLFDGNMTL